MYQNYPLALTGRCWVRKLSEYSSNVRSHLQKKKSWWSGALAIDHMHMTSQKGAHLRWGSNEALPRASSPSMQPGGQPLHCHTAGLARPGPRTERLSANALCQHNTCALRDTSLAPLLWRRDPLWRQCIRSIVSYYL